MAVTWSLEKHSYNPLKSQFSKKNSQLLSARSDFAYQVTFGNLETSSCSHSLEADPTGTLLVEVCHQQCAGQPPTVTKHLICNVSVLILKNSG